MPSSPPAPASPRLLDRLRLEARRRHLSRRTEDAYALWARRFVLFHGRRHPRELGAPEVAAFLTHLAVERRVAAATQNLALAALLFLNRDVLALALGPLPPATRARRPKRLPVVLSRDEARRLLAAMGGVEAVVAERAEWRFRAPWSASIRMRPGSGAGSGSSRRRRRSEVSRN